MSQQDGESKLAAKKLEAASGPDAADRRVAASTSHPLNVLASVAYAARLEPLPLALQIEQSLLADIPHEIVRLPAGENILREGDSLEWTCLLLEGWAYRHKSLPGGRRQIIGFLLPGDLASSWAAGAGVMEHGVRALTEVRLVKIKRSLIFGLLQDHPELVDRLRAAAALEHTILGAWLLNIGQRKAPERIAHLFCELATRMRKVGIVPVDGAYEAPLTQQDLADALGLTSVHVNRVLQRLRARGLIGFRRGVVLIHDMPNLCALADFKDAYLKG